MASVVYNYGQNSLAYTHAFVATAWVMCNGANYQMKMREA